MSIDLAGGLRPEQDLMFGGRPANDEMRQGVNVWISNDDPHQGFGFPRCAVEAIGADWSTPGYSFQAAWPDGRVLVAADLGALHEPELQACHSKSFGAGPLSFRCEEPFRRWTVRYDGPAVATTIDDQIHEAVDATNVVNVALDVEIEMAVPPWRQGSMAADAGELLSNDTVESDFMGGWRFEQLFRGAGRFRVAGEGEQMFSCTGSRICRQGIRRIEGFWGHCWQSALFPSGRAFGYIAYPPREGEPPTYSEGYVYMGDGELVPARVVSAPWLTEFVPHDGDVSCRFETEVGDVVIEGHTFVSLVHNVAGFPSLHQGGVRYRWDDEETFGMIERSLATSSVRWSCHDGRPTTAGVREVRAHDVTTW